MLADDFILGLNNVGLRTKHLLPKFTGVYYVVDTDLVIWYIGRSVNLKRR